MRLLSKPNPNCHDGEPGQRNLAEDAFGETTELQDKFPAGPKVAELGNVKLFSVNTNEVQALQRYGFKGSESFPVSSARVQKMSDALLYLASEDKRGITCRAIPSAQPDKRDLLVAYLEGEPEGRAQLAEMFGGEANSFSDADFAAIAQPVLEMLEGKVAANPSLNVQLLALCAIDKAKKQISLNRSLRVRDVIQAARDWEAGARNVPQVSVWFYDKATKRSVFRTHTTPCPLELAAVVNRVWSADSKSGFSSTYQRALSVGDAYDVFLVDAPLARQKARFALELLITRMSSVLAALGAGKGKSKMDGTWRHRALAVRQGNRSAWNPPSSTKPTMFGIYERTRLLNSASFSRWRTDSINNTASMCAVMKRRRNSSATPCSTPRLNSRCSPWPDWPSG